MSDGFIAKFLNSEIMAKGGDAEPLDVTLGKKTDVAGVTATSSLFSWVKNIFSVLSTVNTTVNTVNAYTARGAVKSVQRGTATPLQGGRAITINSVAPSKCSVSFQGEWSVSGGTPFAPYVVSLTTTTLTVNGGVFSSNATFSYEVVEYY